MSRFDFPIPAGAEILEATGKGNTSNVTLLVREGASRVVLKIYRHRRSRIRESLRSLSHRFIENKRGASAQARRDTEKLSLELWLREGFDVVQPRHHPIPAGIPHPSLWLEYCPFPTVQGVLVDPGVSRERKIAAVRRLAASAAARHRRAIELRQPLLLHEHGTLNHFFIDGDRIVAYDLENGFRPSLPAIEAVSQELASMGRSLIRDAGPLAEPLLREFIEGYGDRSFLRKALEHALHSRTLARKIKRWHDRRKRPATGKTAAVERMLAAVPND